tara:strand:- start:5 stop:205 length:201 start_codon:yes stop_codon:yes gene_type:complete
MFLKVNGEPIEIKSGATINDLLTLLEIPKIRVAVELNGSVIPNSELLTTVLMDRDVLEVVKAIGGG